MKDKLLRIWFNPFTSDPKKEKQWRKPFIQIQDTFYPCAIPKELMDRYPKLFQPYLESEESSFSNCDRDIYTDETETKVIIVYSLRKDNRVKQLDG